MKAWVLNWRLELEEDSNQTEIVYPELFVDKRDAIAYAQRILRRYIRGWWPNDTRESHVREAEKLEWSLRHPDTFGRASHLFQLSDSDNLVFELSRKTVREKSK